MKESNRICDIHCHMLPDVDDGAYDMEEAVMMLDEAAAQQIDAIILTPHYRPDIMDYSKEAIDEAFEALKDEADKRGIYIFKGCEYHVDHDMAENFRSGTCYTLAGSEYCLTEYSHDDDLDYIRFHSHKMMANGYIPIIAHVERIMAVTRKPKLLAELRDMGALIQINANAVTGADGKAAAAFAKKAIKHGWVDFIASDAHNTEDRPFTMKACYEYVEKKFGEETAKDLMYRNQMEIFKNIKE